MNPKIKLDRDLLWRLLDGGRAQVATPVGLLEIEGVENEWVPLTKLDPTPPHMVEAHANAGLPTEGLEVWSNGTYEVIASPIHTDEGVGAVTLSIKRMDRAPIRNWRHFQQMKNEIVGTDSEAVELYPSEERLADNANQYHLWCFPPGFRVPVGFPEGLVISDHGVEQYNAAPHRGKQEPWQPGLTTGQHRHERGW